MCAVTRQKQSDTFRLLPINTGRFGSAHQRISRPEYPRCRGLFRLVGSSGLEPPTLLLSGVRSNQLSYEPIWVRYQTLKIEQYEPMTALHVFTCSRSGGSSELLQPLLAKRPIDLGYD